MPTNGIGSGKTRVANKPDKKHKIIEQKKKK